MTPRHITSKTDPSAPPNANLKRFPGSITQVRGIEVGHHTDTRRPTGCTVVLTRAGAVGGVDVRGAAPGTRETDLLAPGSLVDRVHAVLLTGGSAFGLDAASGVMRWLEARGIGIDARVARVPIVPAAVLFDLLVGDPSVRPDATGGYSACVAASSQRAAEGCVGAGTGAAVGKVFGIARAMKGGVGSASLTLEGVTVGALIACNALGDVVHPHTAQVIAGARTTSKSLRLIDTRKALLKGQAAKPLLAGTNTTIGVIATDAVITQAQAQRLAMAGHDGLARSINPVHTQSDGDTLFLLGTGAAGKTINMMTLATLVAEVTARAVVNAVLAAHSLTLAATPAHEAVWLPAARDR